MSQENVEIVRRAAELYARDLDAFLAEYPPEIEWINTDPEGNPLDTVRGAAAVSALLRDWRSAFTEYEFGVDRCIDAGERVVLMCWQRGRGDLSALPVAMQFAQVMTVRDGEIVLTVNYTNRQVALKAVGLEE